MKIRISLIIACLTIGACTKFEDAELTSRKSFIYFYSSGASYTGAVAEIDSDGGYIIGANIPLSEGGSDALIIKTDASGNKSWEQLIKSSSISALKTDQNGYFILGDSIKLNPTSSEVTELINTRTRLIRMDNQGNIQNDLSQRGSIETDDGRILEVDFHGSAMATDNAGNLLLLGSRKAPGSNERSFITCINPNTFAVSWSQSYGLLDRDYVNCNSLFVTSSSRLVWASKTVRTIQNLSDQYVSISYVAPNSTFENNSLFGQNDLRNHIPEDIQKSAFGYAVAGTYAEQNGSSANIYFVRVSQSGNIIEGSEKYFDGVNLMLDDRDESITEDSGDAITNVGDGYVIAGSITSTPFIGSGGKDIILIKVDPFGEFQWSRLIGGTGDETVSSIRKTPDNGLLICGTNTINGLSSLMLIKTDENGTLTN